MSGRGPWKILGIAQTDEVGAIRRAYADRLRAIDPDADVDGFAALRSARDQALRWARAAARETDAANGVGLTADPLLNPVPDPALGQDLPGAPDDESVAGAEPDLVSPEEPFWPAVRLDELLFPDGEQSEEGFDAAEYEEARQCVALLIEDILGGNIEKQEAGEGWLADRLAHGWPRSAPLLAEAEAALGWGESRGQLGEHPARAFLNERLTGLYFEKHVSQPDHPYHKAWVELSEPGEKGWLGFTRVSKKKVRGLLNLIRERFPEVESRLDPRKVATWEGSGVEARPWPIVFGIVIAIQIAIRLFDPNPSPRAEHLDADGISRIYGSAGDERQEAARNMRITLGKEMFSEPVQWASITARAATLGRELEYTINYHLNAGTPDEVGADAIGVTRNWILIVGREAGWDELVDTKQLAYELTSAIRRDYGAAACAQFIKSGEIPDDFTASPDIRSREKELAFRLLNDGIPDITGSTPSQRSARIPESVIRAVLSDTGFSEAQWDRAVKMEASDEENCAFRLSLMSHVLRRPGEVSQDLLRII